MQLFCVSGHCHVTGHEFLVEAYTRRQRGGEQFEGFLRDRLNVDGRALGKPAAAEAENAVNERLSAPGRVQDVVKVTPQRAAFRGMLLRQLAVTQYRPENVVEVMGDAACQGSDRLHLLRLPQLCLEMLLVDLCLLSSGDIDCRTDEPIRFAVRIALTAATHLKPTPLAIGLTHAVFAFIAWRTALEMFPQCGLDARGVVGVNEGLRSPRGARGGRAVGALTEEGFHLWG